MDMSDKTALLPSTTNKQSTKLYFLSGRHPVTPHHVQLTLLPFFKAAKGALELAHPNGIDVIPIHDNTEPMTVHEEDYFIWYQPQPPALEILKRLQFPKKPSRRHIIVCYENPIGYSWRRWLFNSEFLHTFPLLFSSVKVFANAHTHFWIPAWNYAFNFEDDSPVEPLLFDTTKRNKFMVVNPISGGTQVSPERVSIVKECTERFTSVDLYGVEEQFNHDPWSTLRHLHRGAIPFSNRPYPYRGKMRIFSQYTFTLAIENLFSEFYITEKLAESLATLSIPVYFGSPSISRLLPTLFQDGAIDGHSFGSIKDLVAFIHSLREQDIRTRCEAVISERDRYFRLTSYRRIWDYVLSTLFGVEPTPECALFASINQAFAHDNTSEQCAQFRSQITQLLTSGCEDWVYNSQMRELLSAQARASQSPDISQLIIQTS